jgi:hypothetical protein
MDFEKIWSTIGTVILASLFGMIVTYVGLSLFFTGKTNYCSFQAVQWSEAVEVTEHRSFSSDSRYTAPSFDGAMKYAAMACPNFKGIQIEK